jgi:hypothetical protein
MFKDFWFVDLFRTGYKFSKPTKKYILDNRSKLFKEENNNILKIIVDEENKTIHSLYTILKPWMSVSKKDWFNFIERMRNGF